MCFGTLSLVLTICKNSTVSMGGVRAEANITRDGEGGKGCLDFPHLSKKLKEKGRIFLVPCVSLCFFQNTHKLTRRLSPLPHTHTVGPNLVSFLPSLLSSLSISLSPLSFSLFSFFSRLFSPLFFSFSLHYSHSSPFIAFLLPQNSFTSHIHSISP